jgi:DNA repair protein RecO (recombination protein O)
LLVLRELGFGLEASEWPSFARHGHVAEWDDILKAMRLTGDLLDRDLLTDRRGAVLAARERLVDRLRRVTR